jgi:hypothetical protein
MVTCGVSKVWTPDEVYVPRPGGRRFKSCPRHQDRDKGSGNAPLWLPTLTAKALADYMKKRESGSPYLFPGNTKTGHMDSHNKPVSSRTRH